jgi:hypothetical protein
MRGFVLATVLGLMVGATGRADAGVIFAYDFFGHGCEDDMGNSSDCIVTGSFQVDSDHIGASGNTDISSFVTNLSFTVSLNAVPDITFDPTTGFVPDGVTVTPTGEFTSGRFEGNGDQGGVSLDVDASSLESSFILSIGGVGGGELLTGEGAWSGPSAMEPVPEPGTWALVSVGALMLAVYGQRRRGTHPAYRFASPRKSNAGSAALPLPGRFAAP